VLRSIGLQPLSTVADGAAGRALPRPGASRAAAAAPFKHGVRPRESCLDAHADPLPADPGRRARQRPHPPLSLAAARLRLPGRTPATTRGRDAGSGRREAGRPTRRSRGRVLVPGRGERDAEEPAPDAAPRPPRRLASRRRWLRGDAGAAMRTGAARSSQARAGLGAARKTGAAPGADAGELATPCRPPGCRRPSTPPSGSRTRPGRGRR
jgi:hypothetical protein